MQVYIYSSDMYCQDCGEAIRDQITAEGFAPDDPDDESSFDSDAFPKGPYADGGGEADCPHHCGCGSDCVNAIVLKDGTRIGVWLENPLTCHGAEYVRNAVCRGGEVAELWREWYRDEVEFGPTREEVEFIDNYLVAMAFTASLDTEDGGPPSAWHNPGGDIRDIVDPDDVRGALPPEDLAEIEADCVAFLAENRADIGDDLERAAADFHFTRNGHGAGFWDGDWPADSGRRLTDASRPYGSLELMVTEDDDGNIVGAYLCH